MNIFNPYAYIAGGVLALGIIGTGIYQNGQIHHYHEQYNAEIKHSSDLQAQIDMMTLTQVDQTKTTEQNVIKVVQPPAQIIKQVNDLKKEPLPADCKTPEIPDELKDIL